MRPKLFLPYAALLVFLALSPAPVVSQTVITFDDIPTPNLYASIPNGYQGLTWSSNFSVLSAVQFTANGDLSGYYYGMVTPSNVAYNGSASPVEVDSATNFDFFSAYLTGAWNSNLNIEVEGFDGATLLYSNTVVASATSPTLFTFDYLNIDRLTFNSYGGQSAGFNYSGANFVMDNFTFESIPEPSSLLLTALGAVSLIALLRRKRR
jgi:hypothetical protein